MDRAFEVSEGIAKGIYDKGYEKGRADAERDFQNSDYWNDYLAKVIKDAKANAINNFVINAITEFQKFDKEHGYPALGDISDILCDVAEKLKE